MTDAKKPTKGKRVPLGANQVRKDSSEGKGLAVQDPIQLTAMKVSVFDIEPYDKNPRFKTNSEYKDIKESIRKKGLEQHFRITRKPGAHHYTIMRGGNTRLTILRELHEETKDPQFLMVDTFFEPWVSESDALLSHIEENELRGNLIFIEKSIAIQTLKKEFEVERGLTLSDRELESLLKEFGYKASRTLLSLMTYGINKIYPFMPKALDSGMGKPQVEKIRKFEGQANLLWSHLELETEALAPVFEKALINCDSAESRFDINELIKHFENFTSDETGQSITTVRFVMEQAVNNPTKLKNALTPEEFELSLDSSEEETEASTTVDEAADKSPEPTLSTTDKVEPEPELETGEKETEASTAVDEAADKLPEPTLSTTDEVEPELEDNEPETLGSLRDKNYELAKQIARSASPSLEKAVKQVSDGYGFILVDYPKDMYLPSGWDLKDPAFRKIVSAWFQIFTMSGATTPGMREFVTTHLPVENDIKKVIAGDINNLKEHVAKYMPIAALSDNFFWNDLFEEDAIDSAIELIKGIRKVNRLAKAILKPVWVGGSHE